MVGQISQRVFRRGLICAIFLLIALPLMLSGISIWQITRLLTALERVNHTDQVISHANLNQKLLLDMETGFRGYLLTGKQNFLDPYNRANATVVSALNQLKQLVADNPSQVQRVDELMVQYQQWKQQVVPAIARRQQGKQEPFSGLEGRKQRMDGMRQQIARLIATEEQLRNQRSQVAQQTARSVVLVSVFWALGVGGILIYFIWRQILKISQTYENALQVAQVQTAQAEKSAIALEQSALRLAGLHQIDRAILSAETDEVLIGNALTQLRHIVPHQHAFVAGFDLETRDAHVLGVSSQTGVLVYPPGTRLQVDDFASEQSLLLEVRYIENLDRAVACPPIPLKLKAHGYRSCLCVPLLAENKLVGALNLASVETSAFCEEVQAVIGEVAAQLAIALQQTRLREQLQAYATQLEQRVADRTTQLEEANQELEAFNYSVSHDLRAPLRTIQGFAQALIEDCGEQLETYCRSYIDSIIDDTIQMNELISDLLDYSRLTRTQIHLQPTDLDTVVDEALSQLIGQLEETQAQVQVASPLPVVLAHRSMLIQAMTNLISNAIKFSFPNIQPQVNVFVTHKQENNQDWIQLWVVDNGIGIATEHQERIFRVFERLHGAERYPGTGIGLAIVRKGLEQMGGQVGVESQLGQGSRFWIALPSAVSSTTT